MNIKKSILIPLSFMAAALSPALAQSQYPEGTIVNEGVPYQIKFDTDFCQSSSNCAIIGEAHQASAYLVDFIYAQSNHHYLTDESAALWSELNPELPRTPLDLYKQMMRFSYVALQRSDSGGFYHFYKPYWQDFTQCVVGNPLLAKGLRLGPLGSTQASVGKLLMYLKNGQDVRKIEDLYYESVKGPHTFNPKVEATLDAFDLYNATADSMKSADYVKNPDYQAYHPLLVAENVMGPSLLSCIKAVPGAALIYAKAYLYNKDPLNKIKKRTFVIEPKEAANPSVGLLPYFSPKKDFSYVVSQYSQGK